MKMKKFLIEYWTTGCGAEHLSGWESETVEAETKEQAKEKLVKQLGCCPSFLDEGEDCKITEMPQ